MNPVQRPDFYGGEYTGVVRRRWLIVVALTLVGLVGSFGYLKVTRASYAATAAVYVSPTGAAQSNQLQNSKTVGPVDLDTEAQVVTSGNVAEAAAHLLHSTQPPASLAKQVSVTVPPDSDVLDIACTTSSPATAAVCANAFAQAYLANRSSSASSWLNGQIDSLQDQVQSLQASAGTLATEISALPKTSSTRATDQTELTADRSQLRSFSRQISALQREAVDVSGSHIITDATLPTRPDNPKKSLVLPSGFFGGLILGLMGAFAWDRRDKRIRGAADAERFLDLPVLLNRPNAFSAQAMIAPVRSATGQAFSELARRVAVTLGEGNHVLLVAGASSGPAGSVAAANLAVAMARTHGQAVLVCTDPGSTVSPGVLGLSEGPGLADVMMGAASVSEVAQEPAAVPGLWVITPGAEGSAAGYFMQHDRAQALVSQLRHEARYVIIEAQPGEAGADTFGFAEFADAALVTVEATRTSSTEAGECVQLLQQLRTTVIGVAVLARVARKVRPPQQGQQGPMRRAGRRGELLATAAAPPKTQDGDDRTARRPGGYGGPGGKDWGS